MKLVNLSIAAAAACLFATSAHALKSEDRDVKGSMQVEYTKIPGAVNSFTEIFTEGEVYGRLRANSFWWDWDNQTGTTRDGNMLGLGGSLVYKTAFYKGFGAHVGFYGSIPAHRGNVDGTTNYGKSGKDTYHQRANGTEGGLGNFAEAFLEYKAGKTNVKVGRQGIDSMMIATNDTKMVPNTFEAVMIENKDLPNTTIEAGYIMSQKLRDHNRFHSLISADAREGNDDSGRHKGIKKSTIKLAGGDENPEMLLFTASNKSIPNLKLDAEYVGLQGYINTAILEGNYKIKLNDTWSLTPGVRYLSQMDDGAGRVGGAALEGTFAIGTSASAAKKATYSDINNADGSIIMTRLVLDGGPLKVTAGYSKVSDDADIIAPWRGFPTGGYTRCMAQVDWVANTQNMMLRADYDFNKAGLVPGLKAAVAHEIMNFDDNKIAQGTIGFTDRSITQIDLWQSFKSLPNTEFRFRVGLVNADKKPTAATDTESYGEYRFEINYLF